MVGASSYNSFLSIFKSMSFQSQGILPEGQSADMAYQQAAVSAMDMDTLHFPSIRTGLHVAKAQCH
jgi:hypothetical protein